MEETLLGMMVFGIVTMSLSLIFQKMITRKK